MPVKQEPINIKIRISKQKLYLCKSKRMIKQYSISTSRYGIGNKLNSNKTPFGLHRIYSKIGKNALIGAIFKKRRFRGKYSKIYKKSAPDRTDFITTRIIRLEGLEKGINKGMGIDSLERCIYIHGTPNEALIGKPVSCGCIRLKNKDIIELFNLVKRGNLVKIER
ncbi:MAG: L,D-transpeptidase [Candidatus Omnitrophota bacterium]